MSSSLRILFIADIFAQPGLDVCKTFLPGLIKKFKADFVIANAENLHEGKGLNEDMIKELYGLGIHVLTGGNHSFDKWKIYDYWKTDKNILRPLNYPKGAHGSGFGVFPVPETSIKVGVLNLQGRTFMQAIDDPFRSADWALEKLASETNIIFVDFHAEATAEKMALGLYIDGRATAMVGTHTHIPTADARLLPKGTGYVTDVGMTGSFNGVIGLDADTGIKRFLLGTPHKFQIAEGDAHISYALVEADTETGACLQIENNVYPPFNRQKVVKPVQV